MKRFGRSLDLYRRFLQGKVVRLLTWFGEIIVRIRVVIILIKPNLIIEI